MTVLLSALITHGLVSHAPGSGESGPIAALPHGLGDRSPVIALRHNRLQAMEPSDGRLVALTFDDGPDPRWTPRIAVLLRRFGVPRLSS